MKVEVLMPRLGEGITEGTIVKWWKKPGDAVQKDETLLEISTDKVDSEIPSPYEGVLAEIKVEENQTVAVDSVIAVIETGDVDAVAAAPAAEAQPAPAPRPQPAPVEEPQPAPAAATSAPVAAPGLADVEMPLLGEGVTEGTIVKWWKKPGDPVEKEETLLEISTDKVDSEIPSPYAGVVGEILAGEGQTVLVGEVIARIKTGEGAAVESAPPVETPPPPPIIKSVSESTGPAQPVKAPPAPVRTSGGRFYSPLVRRIARKEGISAEELEQISGSGLHGRVTKDDILEYLKHRQPGAAAAPTSAPSAKPAPAPSASAPPPSREETTAKWQGQRVEVVPMDAIRKKIADHMVASKHISPHVYGVAECDFTKVMNLVKKHKDAFQAREGLKLTINPFILYSVSKAIKDFPDVNSSIEGYNIVKKHYLNIGMAVATERGLIVPTLKNAETLNFVGIARSAYDLAIRARNKQLKVEDVQGATFTVTNYGIFGNIIGFPIINQPNVAIMGVGAIKKRPVVIEAEQGDLLGIRSIGYLTLSFDHRIVDGELGDKFLQRVVYYLQNFDENWM